MRAVHQKCASGARGNQFENGETNTLEVALSCGFSNLSYFHREFKKKYGMTPKRFISLSARAADFHEGSE